jgi:CarD family transcriptional regulator
MLFRLHGKQPAKIIRSTAMIEAFEQQALRESLVPDLPSFELESLIVHPKHGVGRISALEERSFGTTTALVYVIEIIGNGLTVMVPKTMANELGLRSVMSESCADGILAELGKHEMAVQISPWNRRFRAYNEMLASGSSIEVARVLRDMCRLKSDKRLSFGEQRLLEVARGILLQELALAKSQTPEMMGYFMDNVLAG